MLTKEEFVDRYVAHTVKEAGFSHFDTGMPVAEYAKDAAEACYDPADPNSPEDRADGDMAYWGEPE